MCFLHVSAEEYPTFSCSGDVSFAGVLRKKKKKANNKKQFFITLDVMYSFFNSFSFETMDIWQMGGV